MSPDKKHPNHVQPSVNKFSLWTNKQLASKLKIRAKLLRRRGEIGAPLNYSLLMEVAHRLETLK